MQAPKIVFVKIADFDLSNLPTAYQDPNVVGFEEYLKKHVTEDYSSGGLFVKVTIDNDTLIITGDIEAETESEEGLDALQRGIYLKGKTIFEKLYDQYPTNTIVLYNLGMVYSDEGDLNKAISLLGDLTRISPTYAHGWVALAVAYLRNNQIVESNLAAQTAVELAPNDSYALRTAGFIASKLSSPEASILLENAVRFAPKDPIAILALAENLLATHKDEAIKKRVSALLLQVIEVSPGSQWAKKAEDILRDIAYQEFRKTDGLNSEAVSYCLSTLKTLKTMTPQEIGGVALETATLGESGLNVNSPDKVYQLRTLPGKYTGLNVVCIMHTALQQVAPGQDSGFDIKAEYDEALKQFNKNQ